MNWWNHDVPAIWQWWGVFATLLGAVLSLVGVFVSGWAVWNAKGAKQQAQLAREAAIRMGRVTQLSDLIAEMQELQTMLARRDFESIAAKCSHLRGRVVRFKKESYNLLGQDENADLDMTRDQLE